MNRVAGSWPVAEGEITKAWIETSDGDISYRISYRFEAGGRWFTSDRFTFASTLLPEGEQLCSANPVGRKVLVQYDPANPEYAVLKCQPSQVWLIGIGLGIAFFAVGWFGG